MTHMTAIRKIVKKLSPKPGEVLVILKGTWLVGEEDIEALKKLLDEVVEVKGKIPVIIVDDMNDVRTVSKDEMNRLGWFRKDQMSELFKKMLKGIQNPIRLGKDKTDEPEPPPQESQES